MTIPKTNIGIIDVHDTLGDSSYDLGTLCKSSKINPWSKYKPIACADSYWPQGADGNYGLTPKVLSSRSNVATVYDGVNNGWTYTKPTGGASSPFRLGDFRGYYHDAMKGCRIETPYGTEIWNEDDYASVVINTKQITTSQLILSDIKSLGTLFIGIYVPSLDKVETVATAGFSGTVKIPKQTTAGTWEYYVILSSAAQSQLSGGSLVAATYYSVPGTVKGSFTQKKASWLYTDFHCPKGSTLLDFDTSNIYFTMKNQSDRTRTYTKLIMYYTKSDYVTAIKNSGGDYSGNTTQKRYRFDLITSSTSLASGASLKYVCSEISGFPSNVTVGYWFLIYGESGKLLVEKEVQTYGTGEVGGLITT